MEVPPGEPGDTPSALHGQYADHPTDVNRGETYLVQRRRRFQAARRLPPLAPCGCIRDPLFGRHRCVVDALTDRQLDGWQAAIAHLNRLGTPAIVPASVRRALDRRAAA
jgi:hypothetical protein